MSYILILQTTLITMIGFKAWQTLVSRILVIGY